MKRFPEDQTVRSFMDERGETYYADDDDYINSIYYHEPMYAGDRHYCDVITDTGIARYFDPKSVVWID